MVKLHCMCGRKENRTATYCNNIYGVLRGKVRTTKPLVKIPILPNKTPQCWNWWCCHGNEISTYDQAHGSNGELLEIK